MLKTMNYIIRQRHLIHEGPDVSIILEFSPTDKTEIKFLREKVCMSMLSVDLVLMM